VIPRPHYALCHSRNTRPLHPTTLAPDGAPRYRATVQYRLAYGLTTARNLGERLEKLKERHEQGLLHSLDFLKELSEFRQRRSYPQTI
jgi:hypothetical protein